MANEITEIRYQVGEAWKGTYNSSTTYNNAAVVQDPTGLSVYRSRKGNNLNHPLSDAEWWLCIINLSGVAAEAATVHGLNVEVAAAEGQRVSAESGRVSAENARVSAEGQRVLNENARISAESQRVQNENARILAESGRDARYETAEGSKAGSSAGDGSRWGDYKTAEAARETAYGEAEASRNAARVTAEGSSASEAGDGSRWGAYKSAEAGRQSAYGNAENARDAARLTAEGSKAGSEAGDGSRWGDYKTAEAARDTECLTAEGTSESVAGDGSRWGAYKTAEAARDLISAEDHTQAGNDHTRAGEDHTQAGEDHTRAGEDHAQAVSDHQTWSNKAEKDTDAVEGNLAKFDGSGNPVDAGFAAARIHRDLGYNAAESTIVLTAGVTGKYVKCSTRAATANANFAISQPFDVEACSELLIKTGFNPSDNTHKTLDISIISIYEQIERTRTVQAKDGSNNPLYYEVDEDGNPTSEQTTEVTPYPVYTTETYTESRYLPNNEDRFVAIPDSGYYVANIPQSCKCVISYKPGVTDLNVKVVKHGALANLTSQIFGIYEHRTMSEAVVSLAARVEALEKRLQQPGDIICGTVEAKEFTKIGFPQVVWATGAPAANLRPDNLPADIPWDGIPPYIGHIYVDLTANAIKVYFAKGTGAIADYIPLN